MKKRVSVTVPASSGNIGPGFDVLGLALTLRNELRVRVLDANPGRPLVRVQGEGEGKLPTVAELVQSSDAGSLDDYDYNLKTGGQVRLGFPGSRTQTLTFTDGVKIAQAPDLAEAARLYAAGWELGSPARPGVRVHFPGTRQERLVPADEVYARPGDRGSG